ncbi:MAG: D-alanine--D-alanine ligase [Endomicrobiales bacterium]|nr:D-alanine--D-alanine ligase [Endomicrobiales bacterium]
MINKIKKMKIAVLFGGTSSEREISILTGRAVISALKRLGAKVVGIDFDGSPFMIKKAKPDFVFIALHGTLGEDGCVQGMLNLMKIPYSGSGVEASALCMNKALTKVIFKSNNLPTPKWKEVCAEDKINNNTFTYPCFVKPASQGSAIGMSLVKNKKDLGSALKTAFKYDKKALVEDYIKGTEITVGVLGDNVLPAVEIVPKSEFYDFKSKYKKGCSNHIIPPRISNKARLLAQRYALKACKCSGCEVVARVDMIVPKNSIPQILEINTVPGMTETSLLPDAARAAGIGFDELVLKIIEYSLKK